MFDRKTGQQNLVYNRHNIQIELFLSGSHQDCNPPATTKSLNPADITRRCKKGMFRQKQLRML